MSELIDRPIYHRQSVRANDGWLGTSLILGCCLFNLALCFINTRHWASITTVQIAAVSIGLTLAALANTWRDVSPNLLYTSIFVIFGIIALKLANSALDLKILFDLSIPPVFYLLGRRSSVQQSNRLLFILITIAVAVGMFELLAPDAFQNVFNISAYYENKGLIDPNAINYNDNNFATNSERNFGDGRTLLPMIFGEHRIASIFLEPLSLGNFSIICLAWLLSVRSPWTLSRIWLAAGSALCIIMPDSRQASATFLMMLLLRLSPLRTSRALGVLMPIACLLALTAFGALNLYPNQQVTIETDDFHGRLLFSGQLLASWSWTRWFAIEASPFYLMDTGYAYLINNASLLLLFAAWLIAMWRVAETPQAAILRNMISLYVGTSLCIGASMTSIKTAALLWFLFGSGSAAGRVRD